MLGGQWGSWQLTDSPDAPATASWRLNFMSSDWRTVHIKAEGNLSALATPVETLGVGMSHGGVYLVVGAFLSTRSAICEN